MSAAGFFDASFFDPRRHGEALARLASEHLGRGDFVAAFRYSDRSCRLFKAGAQEYLLRSEASRRAGHAEFAAKDLALSLFSTSLRRTAIRVPKYYSTLSHQMKNHIIY